MSFFASVKSFISNATQSKDFPFEIGEIVPDSASRLWTLYSGKKKTDGTPITIFKCDLAKRSSAEVAAAHDALKRLRTTRHPNVIQHLGDTESKEAILIATQLVTPLSDDIDAGAAMWGLHQIAKALSFLNDNQGLVHANLSPSSIYLDREGDWKLFGFEVTASTMELENVVRDRFSLLNSEFICPELQRSDYRTLQATHTHAVDSYAWAKIATWILGSNIPMGLRSALKSMTGTPNARPSPLDVCNRGLLDSDFTKAMAAVDELIVSDNRIALLEQISHALPSLSSNVLAYKFVPKLAAAAETGEGSERVAAIRLMIECAAKSPLNIWQDAAIPPILKLFEANDRSVRITLLQDMGKFADKLTQTAAEAVFIRMANGFTDASPDLRELTVKALPLLAQTLSENIVESSLRFIATLLNDPEAGIRTNTTVCLAKLAGYLTPRTRLRVLVPAFCGRLKDPFPHARQAALRGLTATLKYCSAADLCRRVIPTAAPLLVDPDPSVRAAAGDCIKQSVIACETAIEASKNPQSGDIDVNAVVGTGKDGPAGPTAASGGLLSWAVSSIASGAAKVGGAIVTKALHHNQQGLAQGQQQMAQAPPTSTTPTSFSSQQSQPHTTSRVSPDVPSQPTYQPPAPSPNPTIALTGKSSSIFGMKKTLSPASTMMSSTPLQPTIAHPQEPLSPTGYGSTTTASKAFAAVDDGWGSGDRDLDWGASGDTQEDNGWDNTDNDGDWGAPPKPQTGVKTTTDLFSVAPKAASKVNTDPFAGIAAQIPSTKPASKLSSKPLSPKAGPPSLNDMKSTTPKTSGWDTDDAWNAPAPPPRQPVVSASNGWDDNSWDNLAPVVPLTPSKPKISGTTPLQSRPTVASKDPFAGLPINAPSMPALTPTVKSSVPVSNDGWDDGSWGSPTTTNPSAVVTPKPATSGLAAKGMALGKKVATPGGDEQPKKGLTLGKKL